MSSAGRVANLSGCVARPRAREIGLIGFAAQIQRSSLTGSYVMETAEHREPCESRGSRTVLGARGGESPPRDSTFTPVPVCPLSCEHEFLRHGRNGLHAAIRPIRCHTNRVAGFKFGGGVALRPSTLGCLSINYGPQNCASRE